MLRSVMCAMLLLLLFSASVRAELPAYATDPKFQKEVAAARAPQQTYGEQLDHWKKANKIAGGSCVDCLMRMLDLSYKMQDLKEVGTVAAEIEQQSPRPQDKATAELFLGSALFHARQDKPKPEQLVAADQAFRRAMANDPKLETAHYMEGRTLALLNRDEEARAEFREYVAHTPSSDRFFLRATHFAENPALARARMAPPFTVTTADGKKFSLDEMGGRVVLVDFWATWCGPCNEELPHIQKIAQEFAGEPFVLISVSWDSDAAKWQTFLEKHGMTWNQYRDANQELSRAYGVNAIPHYFTIDADGVLQDEKIGSGSNIEGKLKKLVARAKAAPAAEPAKVAAGEGN